MRSAMFRRASSIGMPRFCSSKTRLNSSAIGPFHLLGDEVQARGQPVPGPEGPADQLDRLGHGGDELADPLAACAGSARRTAATPRKTEPSSGTAKIGSRNARPKTDPGQRRARRRSP